jgi:hypothetical protein
MKEKEKETEKKKKTCKRTGQSWDRAAIDRSRYGKSTGSALSRNHTCMDKETNHALELARNRKMTLKISVRKSFL